MASVLRAAATHRDCTARDAPRLPLHSRARQAWPLGQAPRCSAPATAAAASRTTHSDGALAWGTLVFI